MVKSMATGDSVLLYTETDFQYQHTVGIMILDPSTAPNGFGVDDLLEVSESMVDDAPGYRLKLVDSPLALDVPMLAEDPDFKLRNHVRHVAVPAPGTLDQLAELVADFVSQPLTRSRPMWENLIVSGMEGGCIAMVSKTHHCLQDGVGGAETMAKLFDLEPDPPPKPEEKKTRKTRVSAPPNPLKILQEAYKVRSGSPSMIRTAHTVIRSLLKSREAKSKVVNPELLAPDMSKAPRLFFNGQISSFRSVALGSVSLKDLKTVKNAYGVTLNNTILAVVAIALRHFLEEHDDMPDGPLACGVPVSLSLNKIEGVGDSEADNQVGLMNVKLPVQIEDPGELIQSIHDSATATKEMFSQQGADITQAVIEALPPRVAAMGLEMASGALMARTPMANLGVSNVPGPPIPLYMRGARVVGNYPMGPVPNGVGLGITLMSYVDRMDFSVQGCREKLPGADVRRLAELMQEALDELLEAMPREPEAGKSAAKAPARKKKASGSRTAAKKAPARKKTGAKAGAAKKAGTRSKAASKAKAAGKAKTKAAPKSKATARPKSKAKTKAKAKAKAKASSKS